MKTILVPVDFQNASVRALRYIENVFQGKDITLNLLHVIPADNNINKAEVEKQFNEFGSKVLKNYSLPYEFTIQQGNLLDEIQKVINTTAPSMVIIGTSGQALSKAFVKLTHCPVLIVPENNSKSKIRNIAYANDFHEVKASSAFETLLDLSKTFGAKVHIIHLDRDELPEQDQAEDSLEYYLQLIDHEYASITSEDYVTALQNYVHKENIDVLTVLLRDHGQNTTGTGGKLIEELVTKSDVPFLSLV